MYRSARSLSIGHSAYLVLLWLPWADCFSPNLTRSTRNECSVVLLLIILLLALGGGIFINKFLSRNSASSCCPQWDTVRPSRVLDASPIGFVFGGESRTRISLSTSDQAEGGLTEPLGSTVGLDERPVRGDLQRFKELIAIRSAESGARRGEVSATRNESRIVRRAEVSSSIVGQRAIKQQHTTRTQRYVHISLTAADDESQLESNRISLVARATVLICLRGVLPALGFE